MCRLLLLLVVCVAATRAGPPHASLSLVRPQPSPLSHNQHLHTPVKVASEDKVGPTWSVMQEAVRGVLPPPLWAALSPSSPPQTFTQGQAHAHTQDPREGAIWQLGVGEGGRGLLGGLWHYYLPDLKNVSRACRRDLQAFYTELPRGKYWAIRMVDSWGKIPDGVLAGNTWVLGLRDECVDVEANQELPQAHFTGKYCTMTHIYVETEQEKKKRKMMQPSVKMAAVVGSLGVVLFSNVYGTCMPSTCTQEELKYSVIQHLADNLELTGLACQTAERPHLEYTAADITMIVVLIVLGTLALAGTGWDVWLTLRCRAHPTTGPVRYLLVFSWYTNLPKILRVNTQEGPEVISCLHGIRVLTMSWVVLGHSYLMSIFGSANKALLPELIQQQLIPMQVILNGISSVDTFFFVSGLLVAYSLTKEYEKTKSFSPFHFYLHRFLRLAPPILLLCGIFAVFPPLFVTGATAPALEDYPNMVDLCRKYWWRDSFFLTNWFFNEVDTESCIPVCWYTAVDFQLYILTPFFFLPLLYRRKVGMWWMYALVLASCVIPGTIIAAMELPPTQVQDISSTDYVDYTKWVYTKPWARASPYLVGICLGYFFRVNKGEKVNLKMWQVALGWVVALVTLSLVVFGISEYNTLDGTPHDYNPAISVSYGALHRFAWGIGIGWIVFACHLGYGGPINTFLSHPFWQPLSRLTYTTFLIALNFQFFLYIFIPQVPLYYSHLNRIIETAGVILLSMMCGLVVSLLVESPVLGLERLAFNRAKDGTEAKLPTSTQKSKALELHEIKAAVDVEANRENLREVKDEANHGERPEAETEAIADINHGTNHETEAETEAIADINHGTNQETEAETEAIADINHGENHETEVENKTGTKAEIHHEEAQEIKAEAKVDANHEERPDSKDSYLNSHEAKAEDKYIHLYNQEDSTKTSQVDSH